MESRPQSPVRAQEVKRVPKPWGYEIWWARTPHYVGKVLHINKGESLSLQYHREKEETVMVWTGKMRFEHFREGEEPRAVDLLPGDTFHISPGTRHRMIAIEDCDVFEASTPHTDDVVRLQDRYGRTG